jgi:hypothetical protein
VCLIVGVGASNFVNPYSPNAKSIWLKLSTVVGFEVAAGIDLGSLMINVGDILVSDDKIHKFCTLAVGLLYFSGMKEPSLQQYRINFAQRDFDLDTDEVDYILALDL